MNIGDQMQDFTLPVTTDAGAAKWTLSAHADKIVVLYFYPKDDTPGCTIEGNDFSAYLDDFTAAGAVVLGVSRDGLRSHDKFRAKFNYKHHLIADPEALLCERLDLIRPGTMFGKPVTKLSRSTFVIDRGGKLAHQWRDIKDVTGHAAQVLAAVQAMSGAK